MPKKISWTNKIGHFPTKELGKPKEIAKETLNPGKKIAQKNNWTNKISYFSIKKLGKPKEIAKEILNPGKKNCPKK